jgi:hypothetical protein
VPINGQQMASPTAFFWKSPSRQRSLSPPFPTFEYWHDDYLGPPGNLREAASAAADMAAIESYFR